ncbi:MAG: EAL domain-containing protein [Pseudomonadales bacterium]|nr:EAL domain-containing protein [Pseudomonadales bacterium]
MFPSSPKSFFPCYQPIIGMSTGKIEGYEALARFRDSRGEIRSAGPLFFDQSLDADFKLAVDREVRMKALQAFAAEPQLGYLSVNISPEWVERLRNPVTLPTVEMVAACGIDPARVIIEITETRGDLQALKEAVALYHRVGMRVAIDDFGAGASQIDRIEALAPDIVKLDMGLFKQASRGGISADITLAMTTIASRVGCLIVCEGVEKEDEFHFGIECGSSHVQGFLFHEAQPYFLDPDDTLAKIRKLQAAYLGKKARKLRLAASRKERLKVFIRAIQSSHADNADVPAPAELHAAGVLRYYICDIAGNQLTPNFDIDGARLIENAAFRGLNWAHRPYFPRFIAWKANADGIFSSGVYRDVNSHDLCKTYAVSLDPGRILLVDALVPDEIIYARYSQRRSE